MAKFKWDNNVIKDIKNKGQNKINKIGSDFLKQFNCPICNKQVDIKSIENGKIFFNDFCHEEFKKLIEEKLK